MLSVLHFLNSRFKPRCWSTNAGAIEKQSQRAYAYLKKYFELPGCEEAVLLIEPPTMERTQFRNGAVVEIITGGSERSVSGPAPQKFAGDEIDHWERRIYDTAMQSLVSQPGIPAQVVLTSSRYYDFGLLGELLDEADDTGLAVYTYNVWDVMVKCPRHPDCEGCPLFEWVHPVRKVKEKLCGGEIGPRCRGHISLEDVLRKFRRSHRTFLMQQLLDESGPREGLVYSDFSLEPGGNARELPEGVDLSLCKGIGGVDFGYSIGHPAVIELRVELPDGTPFWVAEWYQELALPSEHRAEAKRMMREWEARGLKIHMFWCDPARPDQIAQWQAEGLPALGCPDRDIKRGVDKIRDAVLKSDGSRHWFVSPTGCPMFLKEITKLYQLKRRPGGGYWDVPIDRDNHAADAVRYAEVGGAGGGWSTYSSFAKETDRLEALWKGGEEDGSED